MSAPKQEQQQQPTPPPLKPCYGIVKQVNSGDSITIRGQPKGGPPPEKTLILSNVIAPKLGRRPVNTSPETKDEPYAWEAREFLRKKLIGQEIVFVEEKSPNNNRTYGRVWIGKDMSGPSITEQLVSEGLVTVKRDTRAQSPELTKLQELEDAAKSAGKGKWSTTSPSSDHVRDVKYSVETPLTLVDKYGGKPVKALIEHVRDGSTVKALLLPDFYHITLAISGIRCPTFKQDGPEPFADQAKFFVESRLLQRDIEVLLESANNTQFVGSILHPKGNIAEALLNEGFARIVDWSMSNIKTDKHKLYLAEKAAKDKRLHLWKDYVPARPSEELNGTIIEITSADSMIVRMNNGETKKIFLSSIRPPPRPKQPQGEDGKPPAKSKDFRPLYDIPWMFEAREFLRKKLIGKPVKVIVDYVQPARDNFPEKTCCTVLVGKVNIAEAMVSKGFATVVRYRQNDDQRSSYYNDLLVAESKAEKSGNGLHAKKDVPLQRIRDVSTDPTAAKSYLQSLKRAREIKAVVEFVTSGSRLKLFIPKEYCLITFLLAGVKCPRAARITPGTGGMEAEPFGEEALAYTRKFCFQKDVDVQVENMETKGSGFIGCLFVDNVNLSVALVEEGLAEISNFVEQGELLKALKAAEERAKAKKLNIWKNRVEIEVEPEEKREETERAPAERKIDYQEIVVSEITDELHVYTQRVDQKATLEGLLARLRQEIETNPPLAGAYTPKKGDLAIAKFTVDNEWYRVKIEKVAGPNVSVFYIDYGNREVLDVTRVAAVPAGFTADKPFATENILAIVTLPKDEDDKKTAMQILREDTLHGNTLLLNVEHRNVGAPIITLADPTTKEDIVKALVAEGYLLCYSGKDRKHKQLREEYRKAEKEAREKHLNIWQYGDITEDDAKEFGIGH
ncbi:staphylococcal nuclease domain-containing protein 1 [Phymastichus coffea]|uniref:staphylococcal nuclease domain-containing protein 1 n=1 Tax=Phymastichus coffea TaxID=108790 RepID=UPI00273B1401|nr:staphylococcal nuclease domain-containing protein 1 [Phymastichus coffea]XP_058791133.1 staphylococcal nuclease domain-containing protein 1 [Phymastichus coffea]